MVIFNMLQFLTIFQTFLSSSSSECGCKTLRKCYSNMLSALQDRDEVACIENAAVGTSTVTIFLKALKQFCGNIVNVDTNHVTYEGRRLYEVVLNVKLKDAAIEDSKPVIFIDAGQQGGTEPVVFALYIIEQLVACFENYNMIRNVRWVILPCVNPDGMEFARHKLAPWTKNVRPSADNLGFGVDISRNFDNQWGSCPRIDSSFSNHYPGLAPVSENETIFIKDVLSKHKRNTKIYLSIRKDGHSLLYPYGYMDSRAATVDQLIKVASEVSTKVNQRSGGVHLFVHKSIYELQGKPHCGHSVDYAYDLGIPLAYEMRVFLDSDNRIISKFQMLPPGYENSLRNGYFSGIRELYNAVTNEKKYGPIA